MLGYQFELPVLRAYIKGLQELLKESPEKELTITVRRDALQAEIDWLQVAARSMKDDLDKRGLVEHRSDE